MPDGDGSRWHKIRIDKYLADMGIGTRSEVKKILKSGQVTLNGEKIKKPEQKINSETDEVLVNQKPVVYQEFEYYMLNKIITFDNGEKYIVYDSVVKDNVYYYMLVGISEDENTVLKEKIKFSTANSDSTENLIFSDVTDLNLLQEITMMFFEKMKGVL